MPNYAHSLPWDSKSSFARSLVVGEAVTFLPPSVKIPPQTLQITALVQQGNPPHPSTGSNWAAIELKRLTTLPLATWSEHPLANLFFFPQPKIIFLESCPTVLSALLPAKLHLKTTVHLKIVKRTEYREQASASTPGVSTPETTLWGFMRQLWGVLCTHTAHAGWELGLKSQH